MEKRGKIIFLIVIMISIILISFNKTTDKTSDQLRIRVISNSNSSYDINIKNEVVSILKKYINATDTKKEVVEKLELVKEKIREYGKSKNIDIKVEQKKTKFPAKSLNGKVIPSGIYDTLLITIGEGEGSNYWSLLYPEFFGITFEDIDSKNIEVRSYIFDLFCK